MARPRDIRFYEIPLPKEIPRAEEWLLDYHEHSRQLVDYIEYSGLRVPPIRKWIPTNRRVIPADF